MTPPRKVLEFILTRDDGFRDRLLAFGSRLETRRPRETKWTFDNDSQCFTITTLQGIRGGDQIYDSYGQKCNHRFLLNYGFAVEDNKEQDGFCPNEVPIEITLQQQQSADDDNYSSLKTEFWTRDSSPITKRVRVCVSNNDNTKSLLSMLRVAASNGAELQAITQAGPYMYRSVKDVRFSIGVDNEIRAMELLKNIVDEQVRRAQAQYRCSEGCEEGDGFSKGRKKALENTHTRARQRN